MTVIANGLSSQGFASSIARHVRLIAERERATWPSISISVRERHQKLEDYAARLIELGDDEPGVVAIWRAQGTALRPSIAYDPGPAQSKVLAGPPPKNPDAFHSGLVAAAIEDLATATEARVRSQSAPEVERARRDLLRVEEALERERQETRRLADSVDEVHRLNRLSEEQRRGLYERLQGLVAGTDSSAEPDDAEPDLSDATALPGFTGVYVRQTRAGALVFAARWPKAGRPGKSEGKAGFASPQEAHAFRSAKIGADDAPEAQAAADVIVNARRAAEGEEGRRDVRRVGQAMKLNPGMSQKNAEQLAGVGSAPAPKGSDDDD